MGTAGHAAECNVPYLLEQVINYSTQAAAAADVIEAIDIPANSLVLNAGIDVLTVDSAGNSGTVALGDGSVVYVAAAAPTALGQMTAGDAVAEMFVSYTTANTLDVTGASGTINGKVRIWALVCDMSTPDVTQRATFS